MRVLVLALLAGALPGQPVLEKEDIFPLNALHNHASGIVELGDGSLLVCWYRGSGERTADDVLIMGARKARGGAWSAPFVLADTPGFPDTNPTMYVDPQNRLWLYWNTILANRWETALLNYRMTRTPGGDGPPTWDREGVILPKPHGIAERARAYAQANPALLQHPEWPAMEKMLDDRFAQRMGWMTRVQPTRLRSGRLALPLYSDGFNFSLVALSDDGGESWFMSAPIVGMGGVQPSIVERKDGTLVAYMRDNGPPPKRVQRAESADGGLTWSYAVDEEEPNSGTSVQVVVLPDGQWLMVNNDTERGRHSLVAAVSADEGKTWRWRRHLELDSRPERPDSYHYPSLWLGKGGTVHATYSVFRNEIREGRPRKTIRYARFNAEWVKEGDR